MKQINNNQIHIVIKNGKKWTVKLELPPKANLLDRSLKMFYMMNNFNENEEEYIEDYIYPHGTSKELLKNKLFRYEFKKAYEEFDDGRYQSCKLRNVIELSSKEQKIIVKQNLNKKKWGKLFASILGDVIKNNVEFVIIHISSNISSDEKAKIADDFSQVFFNIPVKKFYSDGNNKSTLVETFFFGSDMEKYTPYED